MHVASPDSNEAQDEHAQGVQQGQHAHTRIDQVPYFNMVVPEQKVVRLQTACASVSSSCHWNLCSQH